MDPRQLRDGNDAVHAAVHRVAGRPLLALSRFTIVLFVIVPAVVVGVLVTILFAVWAMKMPPMVLMTVPVIAGAVAWVRYGRAELASLRAIDRAAPPGAPVVRIAAAESPHVPEVEIRLLRAHDSVLHGFIALAVTLLLCSLWDVRYLGTAAAVVPFALFSWWVVRRSRMQRDRLRRDADARVRHPEAFAHPERLEALGTPSDASLAELPVLLGQALLPADYYLRTQPAVANALVCHERGVYLVEATLPTRSLRRSRAEPAHDRRAVLALAQSGELWRAERIQFSSAWQDIAGWTLQERELTLWANDGTPVRWQHLGNSDESRVGREAGAQLADVTAELQRRLGPPTVR